MNAEISETKGISVRYIYSACVVISTKDVKILNDPWFTEGAYDGSWFQFPKIEKPIESIGDVDLIFISHVHPDHYDGDFLKQYFSVYGKKEIIIAAHTPNHLANKMRADGIVPTILETTKTIGNTSIDILPHKTGSSSDIDSALIVKYFDGYRNHCVVNANDIIFDDSMISTLKDSAQKVDILLCGYTGAGPYPQTYFDVNDENLVEEAEKKRLAFFKRYLKLTTAINAKINIPFAGKYILGGRLAGLNDYRGVADAIEVLAIDANAIVLADNGGTIDTVDFKPSAIRNQKYKLEDVRERESEISSHKMDYERLIPIEEIHQLPIKRLLIAAARRAHERSECVSDYYFVIPVSGDELALINAKKTADKVISFVAVDTELPIPRSQIEIDIRYLFGLLTNVYHWNNAEVGSQYNTRRFPNELNRKAQAFLNYLAI